MNKNIRDIRMLRIAAMILYRNIPNITIRQNGDGVNHTAFDLIATTEGDDLRFGINVVSSSYSKSNAYERYLTYLNSIDYSDKENRIPILLMAVNESTETAMVGFQVGWKFGRPVIFKKTTMMSVTPVNAQRILDKVKAMDDTIRMLSDHGMKIIKTINLERTELNGLIRRASMVYMRDFTEEYKMKQKTVVDERERFDRLLNGIPEEEYPNDFLDESILGMVRQEFPDANIQSHMLLFSNELTNWQHLSQFIRLTSSFLITPDFQDVNVKTLALLEDIDMVHFNVDIFVENPANRAYFERLTFNKSMPLQGWLKTFNDYSKAIESLHSPAELF